MDNVRSISSQKAKSKSEDKSLNIGKVIYKIYVGIGIASISILALCVIFAVIMRYCFNISFTFLEEFMTTVFAFSTFWGIGICIMEDEHVIIDSLYERIPTVIKRWVKVFNLLAVGVVDGVMFYQGLKYALRYGNQISMGMRVPMIFMYGIIPLGTGIALICILFKVIETVQQPKM